jgi:hypothetical protein
VTAPTFAPAAEGYVQPEAKPITLISTGNSAATISTVTLSGTNAECFTLNRTGGTIIAAGATDDSTYTVRPIGGLEPGTYTAIITAFYDNGSKASADVGFTVTGRVAAPIFSPAPGTYPSAQQVAITCETEGAFIYYTTDGSEPTTASTLYRSPVTVAETTTLRAIAVKEGMENSEIAQAVFIIDPTGSLTELHTGENTVALDAVYQAVSFRFTPGETGAYRFRCESESVYPTISVLDGSTRVAFRDQSPFLTGFNCAAELEGGKTYTVQLESLNGTGSIKVLVQPTALYQIYQDPATVHGAVTMEQGGVPATDGSALSGAYAGSDVLLWAEPEEGYALAELRILDADGKTVSTESFFAMPESDVTVSARFEKAYILSYEGDEHAEFFDIWIDGLGLGAFADREVMAGQQVEMSWTCEGDYLADGFTVTTASGSPVPYRISFDAERNTAYLVFTMPAEDVHAAVKSRAAGFDNAAFTLPAAIKTIEESAFEGNPAMHVVYVPDTCTAIGANAFKDCTGLTQIRLPKNCTIDGTAFSGCTGLIAIYAPAGGTTETWAKGSGIPFAAE